MPAPKDTPRRISEALRDDKSKRMGDTLDFYNDSLPRRAVEGLFDKADKPRPAARDSTTEEPEAATHKKTFDDLEENLSIYSTKKTRDARRRTFLDEAPEPAADINPRRRNSARLDIDYDDEDIGGYTKLTRFLSNIDVENLPVVKMAVGAVIIIVLIIMTALVFRVNSVNAQLAEANNKLARAGDDSADYQRMLIENGGLKEQIDELEKEIERVTALLETSTPISQTPNPVTPGVETQPPQATPGTGVQQPANSTTYVVQRGDTLSSIAQRYYGNSGEYRRIMDANNLTNTNIFPGQPLIIPPR